MVDARVEAVGVTHLRLVRGLDLLGGDPGLLGLGLRPLRLRPGPPRPCASASAARSWAGAIVVWAWVAAWVRSSSAWAILASLFFLWIT